MKLQNSLKWGGRVQTALIAFTIASMAGALTSQAGNSATAPVCLAPNGSLLWKTAAASPLSVDLTWPKNAATAEVVAEADGRVVVAETVSDISATNAVLAIAAPETSAVERVLDLTLIFKNGSGAVVETRSARIGLVRGATEQTTTTASFRALASGTRTWEKTNDKTAVVPAYGETTLNGVAQTDIAPPDWIFCHLAPGGNALASMVGGETETATIFRMPRGFTIIFQ